jgi:hypothetical protein
MECIYNIRSKIGISYDQVLSYAPSTSLSPACFPFTTTTFVIFPTRVTGATGDYCKSTHIPLTSFLFWLYGSGSLSLLSNFGFLPLLESQYIASRNQLRLSTCNGAYSVVSVVTCASGTSFCNTASISILKSIGMYNSNTSDLCASERLCSGLGVCSSTTHTCTCNMPDESSIFAGIQMATGSDCSILRTQTLPSNSFQTLLYFLTSLTMAIALFGIGFFKNYEKVAVVKRASAPFLILCCVGCVIMCIGTFLLIPNRTSSLCESSVWITHFGFILVYGSIFVKTYRIYL